MKKLALLLLPLAVLAQTPQNVQKNPATNQLTTPLSFGSPQPIAAPALAGTIAAFDPTTGNFDSVVIGSGIGYNPATRTLTSTATGTVTSFSAGNLSPLFTTSVSNPTLTPALSFTASNAAQNAALLGPVSGGAGAYSFRSIAAADLQVAATGNLTEATSSVLTITGGTNSVVGSGTTVQVKQAGTSQAGYLSAADWNTFNGKQAAGNYITALTGDGTAAGPGSAALTLATVNTNVGTFAVVTVNGKGLTTAAANISGDITTSGAVATLATVNSNVGSFGDSTHVAAHTVNAKGLITATSNVAISASGIGALVAANNLSDVASASTSRTNLGLGTAAVKAASGAGGTVASVTGTFTSGHIATFADTLGTIQDGGAAPVGTVTSVALALPSSILTVSGSPVTGSGTLTGTLATQTANFVWAGPTTGAAATPTFRALVAADIPSLSYVTSVALAAPANFTVSGSPVTGSGTLTFAWSGLTTNGLLQATGASAVSSTLTPSGLTSIGVGTVILAGSSSGTTTLTPAAVASGTLTLPAATDTLVGRATTDTLTNKSIAGSEINSGTVAGTYLAAINLAASGNGGVTGLLPNGNLANSAITIAGTSTSLGGSITLDTITGLSSTGIVYRSAANTLAIVGYTGGSLGFSGGNLTLSGDAATPGNSQYYGTNGSGVKGYYALVAGGSVTSVALAAPANFTVSGSPVTTSGTLTFAWSGLTTNGLLQATSASAVSSTLTPSGLTSIGVNTVTAATTLTLNSATIAAGGNTFTFAGGSSIGDSTGSITVQGAGSFAAIYGGSNNAGWLIENAGNTSGTIQAALLSTSTVSSIGLGIAGYTSTATSGSNVGVSIADTYNQSSGTAANTDLKIKRTETAIGSGNQYLIDAITGSTDEFHVTDAGAGFFNGAVVTSSIQATSGTLTGLTALAIRDTSAAFDVTLAATSSVTLTAGRTLTIDVANASRTLKMTGNATLNQDVSTAGSPSFTAIPSPGAIGGTTPAAGNFTTLGTTSGITETTAGIATTSTPGLIDQNTTASTSGATVQYSPSRVLISHAWNTTSTAADNYLQEREELRPTSAATPTSTLYWSFSRSASSTPTYSDQMSLTSAGVLSVGSILGTASDGAAPIKGTNTNDSASAGYVGEYVTASVARDNFSFSSGTAANVVSISLTAGDWIVAGNTLFTVLSGTEAVTRAQSGISTTSATLPSEVSPSYWAMAFPLNPDQDFTGNGMTRVSLASTTTVYVVAQINWTGGVGVGGGGSIQAWRIR